MQTLGDLLPTDRFQEPPEVAIIKQFVQEKFQELAQVSVRPAHISIQVKSAALAGALRSELPALQQRCQTDKRLVIRIG
jgi:hypothetical protein